MSLLKKIALLDVLMNSVRWRLYKRIYRETKSLIEIVHGILEYHLLYMKLSKEKG